MGLLIALPFVHSTECVVVNWYAMQEKIVLTGGVNRRDCHENVRHKLALGVSKSVFAFSFGAAPLSPCVVLEFRLQHAGGSYGAEDVLRL